MEWGENEEVVHPPAPSPSFFHASAAILCLILPSHNSPSLSHASTSLLMLHPALPIPHPPFACFNLPSHASPSPSLPSHTSPSLPMLHPPFPCLILPFPCFTLPFPCLNLPSHVSTCLPMSQPGHMLFLFMQSFLLSKTTCSYFLKLLQDFVVELSGQLAKSSC